MKTFYYFILSSSLLLLSNCLVNLQAQTFDWAQRGGLYAYDYGYGVSTDNAGNVYAAGKFEQDAIFGTGAGSVTLPNQGNHDIFVAQYSASGTLNWIHTGGGPSGDYAHALACDKVNNLYIAGEIQNLQNGPAARAGTTQIVFPGSSITLNDIGDNDAFVANYDLNGNLLWARNMGGYYNDKAQAVAYDTDGNVLVAGFYNDTAYFASTTPFNNATQFGPNTTTITGSTTGLNDMFVAKYDKNGNFLWVQQVTGPGRDEAKSVGCDAAGNVYVCGLYSDSAQFGNLPLFPLTGYYNTFLAKYSPSGVLQWVKSSSQGPYDNVAWALTLDKNGLIYVAGEFNASVYFGNVELITKGMADVFVTCYDENGNVQWATSAGGQLIDRARGIGTDGTNVYITGQFGSLTTISGKDTTITTAGFGSTNLMAADSSDIFVAELNSSGKFLYAKSVGGIPDSLELLGYESGNAISADAAGNAYATGSTLQGGIFGSTALAQYSRTDFFLTKVSPGATGLTVLAKNNQDEITIYPNPSSGQFTIDLAQLPDQRIEMNIYNGIGQLIDTRSDKSPSKINLNLSAQNSGIYFIKIITEDQTLFSQKVVLQN